MAQIIIEVSDEVLAKVKKSLEYNLSWEGFKAKDPLALLKSLMEGDLVDVNEYISEICEQSGLGADELFGDNTAWYECTEEEV